MLKILGLIALIAIIFGVSFSSAFGILVKFIVVAICVIVGLALFGYLGLAHGKTLRKVIGWIVIVIGGFILLSGIGKDASKEYQSAYNWCIDSANQAIRSANSIGLYYKQSDLDKMTQDCINTANVVSKNVNEQKNNSLILGVLVMIVGGSILPETKKQSNQKNLQQNKNNTH